MRRLARMIAVLAVLAVAAGSVINAAQAISMAIDMAASHSNGAMPDCDDCQGGDHAEMACASACVTPLAAVILPGLSLVMTSAEAVLDPGVQQLVGHSRPPDPYPPRTTVLG